MADPSRPIRIYMDSGTLGFPEFGFYIATLSLRDNLLGRAANPYVLDADLRHRVVPGAAHGTPLAGFWLPDLLAFLRPATEDPQELLLSIHVDIDIKPGSELNPVNPRPHGVIPVAILTTEDFDALTVDADSVLFGPNEAEKRNKRAHVEDVDGDDDLDLLSHFRTQDTGIALGDTEACLIGQTYDGVPIMGCDSVRTVPPGGSAVSTTVSSAVSSTNCGLDAELAFPLPPLLWLWRRRRSMGLLGGSRTNDGH
jgi:hypothetical protein